MFQLVAISPKGESNSDEVFNSFPFLEEIGWDAWSVLALVRVFIILMRWFGDCLRNDRQITRQ